MCLMMVSGVKKMDVSREERRERPRWRLLATRRWRCRWVHRYVHLGYSFLMAGKLYLGWVSSVWILATGVSVVRRFAQTPKLSTSAASWACQFRWAAVRGRGGVTRVDSNYDD